MPKISVIMPVYNGEKYLRQAIDSILSQTFSDFEFIIINDASKDSTEEIIKSYNDERIVYLKNEENLGVAGTLNKGIDAARGEYIARMDADDISMPDRFLKQVTIMDSNKDIGVCGGNLIIFGEEIDERNFIYSETDKKIRVDMIFNSAFAHPAVMIRSSILSDNIRYDIDFEKAEDYKMWYDIMRVSKGYNIQEPLLRYRHHQKQVTKVNKDEQTVAVTKMRKVMYDTLQIDTQQYLELFSRLCDGIRIFNESEYMMLRELMKKTIAASNEYDKKELKKTLSSINYNIQNKSKIKNYKPISYIEYLYMLRGIINAKMYHKSK